MGRMAPFAGGVEKDDGVDRSGEETAEKQHQKHVSEEFTQPQMP